MRRQKMAKEKNLFLTNFAQRLKQRRRELQFTQEKLAEKANLAWGYVGELERGKKTPSIATATVLAKALNVSLNYFIEEEAPAYLTKSQDYLVNEKTHAYFAQSPLLTKGKTKEISESLLNFYHSLSKAITLASSISNENSRTTLLTHLTKFGLDYFKTHETGYLKEFSKNAKLQSEHIKELITNLKDKELAQRILSSLQQLEAQLPISKETDVQ